MVVETWSVLLFRLVSVSLPLTVAALTSVPLAAAATSARIVIVACPPSARLPRAAVTVLPEPLTVPWLDVADTKTTPLGSVSTTCTPVASEGPLLVTASVYVSRCPGVAGSGEPVLSIAKSINVLICVET